MKGIILTVILICILGSCSDYCSHVRYTRGRVHDSDKGTKVHKAGLIRDSSIIFTKDIRKPELDKNSDSVKRISKPEIPVLSSRTFADSLLSETASDRGTDLSKETTDDSQEPPPAGTKRNYEKICSALSIFFQVAGMLIILLNPTYGTLFFIGFASLAAAAALIPIMFLIGYGLILFKNDEHELPGAKKYLKRALLWFILDSLLVFLLADEIVVIIFSLALLFIVSYLIYELLRRILRLIKRCRDVIRQMHVDPGKPGSTKEENVKDFVNQRKPWYKIVFDILILLAILSANTFLFILANPVYSIYLFGIALGLIIILALLNIALRSFGNGTHPKIWFKPYLLITAILAVLVLIPFEIFFGPGPLVVGILQAALLSASLLFLAFLGFALLLGIMSLVYELI